MKRESTNELTPFPRRIAIAATDVHVVRFALDRPFEAALALLDDDERSRASRFVFDTDRRRYIHSHAWVRTALGRCLDRDPASLRFTVGPHGKPRLVESTVDLRHNLSHAADRALLAVALGSDVGVDIERERPVEVSELARRFFASAESAELEALPEAERTAAFFRCWTRKEAFIKALGDGFGFPLDGFEVSLAEGNARQVLRTCREDPAALHRWRIESLPAEAGYAAAVAVRAETGRLCLWDEPALGTP